MHIPSGSTLLVDVSNLTRADFAALKDEHMVLVSTHKTFNFLHEKHRLPDVPTGTHWIVLSVPHVRTDDGQAHTAIFDGSHFRPRRSRSRTSPRLRYLPKKLCTIVEERHSTKPAHAMCEVDDLILALLAKKTGLDVFTHDHALKEHVRRKRVPHISDPMRRLLRHTEETTLVWSGHEWTR